MTQSARNMTASRTVLAAPRRAVTDAGGQWEGYDGKCRDLDAAEAERLAADGRPCAWRR